MDQERSVDIERVSREMEQTRRSILDTVDELKDRVHERADWRHYTAAYPVASLIVAAACGLALARLLVPAVRLVGIPLLLAPRLARRRPRGLAGTWAKLATTGGALTQLAALPALASEVRRIVGRARGKRAPLT